MILFPWIRALIYLIARGKGMAERAQEAAAGAKKEADDYIRQGRVRIAEGQIAQLAAQNGRQDSTKGERSSTTANRRERNHLPHN